MLKEDEKRIRWLTQEEVGRLIHELPKHLIDLVIFSLATGLRKSNVTGLQWKNVDLVKRHALIHLDESKTKKAIPVPLNETAVSVIRKQLGKHSQYVFSYKGKRINQCNTKAWRNALKRAGIENFRWHDLRHTWARVGTYKMVHLFKSFSCWVDGRVSRWCCGMHILAVIT